MRVLPATRRRLSWAITWTVALTAVFLLLGCQGTASGPDQSREQTARGGAKATPRGSTEPTQTAAGREYVGADESAPADRSTQQEAPQFTSGKELFACHCAACHGERGDGNGIAAPFLFPKSRNFRTGRFKLVSTRNNVPTADDLDAVLTRGMPGSSMPSWPHLSPQQRTALSQQVFEFWRDGIREQEIQFLKEDEELTDEELAEPDVQEEIEAFVTSKTTPGETTDAPSIAAPDAAAIAHGKDIYLKLSCHSCHGKEGKGDAEQAMFDDEGYPTTARDYTAGIFKGGHDPASLFRRIAYGMPGTPMPSTPPNLATPEEIVDLVHFLRSLSDEETRQSAIMNRTTLVAGRVDGLSAAADAADWNSAASVRLTMTPLWWRDTADPDLRVQALHDGESLAFRLTWHDATGDRDAARTESFDDAAALELFVGDIEPFLGMGNEQAPVDVWFWEAHRQGPPTSLAEVYPRTVVDRYPFSETVVASAELQREGARAADQPDLSLPARASGNQIVPVGDGPGAASLAVAGPGSTTFRIPANQYVSAHGEWKDGVWSVAFRRPLSMEAGQGVSLQPGGRASVAFAIWDGSHQDRDGKKLITIWQDLELED